MFNFPHPVDTASEPSGFVESPDRCGGVKGMMEDPATRTTGDDDLVRGVAARDASAIRLLFNEHAESIYHLLFRLLGDADDANDVLQESFLRAIGKIDHYGGPSLGGWLRSIAYRLGLNRLRSEKRRRTRETVWARQHRPEANRAVDFDLIEAVDALPHNYRNVVLLFYFQDESHERIAEILDIPVGTSKTWLARGRERLRHQLGAEGS